MGLVFLYKEIIMKNEEFLNSLKSLVVDEKRAEKAYRDMMANRENITSSSSVSAASSESSGNIQEIGYEKSEDEEFTL